MDKDMSIKTPEEIMNEMLGGGNKELDLDSLEKASGGREIHTREQLLRVMNGDDVHMLLDLEERMYAAQKELRALPLSDSSDAFATAATLQLQYAMTLGKLMDKYRAGTIVPTPDGDIVIPD